MLRIKIKGKRLKLLNLLILTFIILTFLFYVITFICLIFSYKKEAVFITNKDNYKLKNNVTFTSFFNTCVIKEKEQVITSDKIVKQALYSDLKEDGFKLASDVLIRITKVDEPCKKVSSKYEKIHEDEYKSFFINGDNTVFLTLDEDYVDEYVTLIINNKESNNVKISSNLNQNKAGTYLITYKAKIKDGYYEYLYRKINVVKKETKKVNQDAVIEVKDGVTFVNGILIVNKNYGLPKDYDPKVNKEALSALKLMQADAKALNLDLPLISGYRTYEDQIILHQKYVDKDGEELANTYSAKPGYSEHQTGLAFDVGSVDRSFSDTLEAKWLEENCHLYGFIIRYPKGKTDITGYIYEPWHIRYLGVKTATKVKESGLTLEEYLGI